MASLAKRNNLKPYLLVHPNCLPDFDGIESSDEDPNCVVLGDAVDEFSYKNLNKVFIHILFIRMLFFRINGMSVRYFLPNGYTVFFSILCNRPFII